MMGKFSCYVESVGSWVMMIVALKNGKLTKLHSVVGFLGVVWPTYSGGFYFLLSL